ncbi:hypothetical protein JNUCC1_02698 [Lentibacillus sp. JNUCC-1]|nr:hypothetical protein [Lentibacillus sp. JNUCC-1]MUV38827.1 hypothetical protein [Lentibacillus sp. JNUCC-1]
MLNKVKIPMIMILLLIVIIVVGDDETRHFLKESAKRMLKRPTREV